MPSLEQTKLIELLLSFQGASTVKAKSELLGKLKHHILNEMKEEEIRGHFIQNSVNFEQLFQIDVWTASLDQTNGIVNFTEPYEIVDRIFNCFNSLEDCLRHFQSQIRFIVTQNKDEKIKHLCVKQFVRLIEHLGKLTYHLFIS
jgi:hypothetical protein